MAEAPCIKLFGTRIVMEADHDHHQNKGEEEEEERRPSVAAANGGTATMSAEDKAAVAAGVAGLPCPRCKSKETKFCYFNNYNVNQPRHFCRGCQRYWTAGGALRNVPVGAGRRKVRPNSSHDAAAGAFGYHSPAAGLEGMVVQQWVVSHRDGFPAKRPNNSFPDRIR